MPRDQGTLPWRELGVNLLGQALIFRVETRDFLRYIDGRIVLHKTQLLDLRFKFGDRLFEFQKACFHVTHFSRPVRHRVAETVRLSSAA